MNKVEEVARAMAENAGFCWEHCAQSQWKSDARAAIEAMRTPTEAMWQAWRSVNCTLDKDGMEEFTHFAGDYGNWLACHDAMIDAALNPQE